MVGRTIGKYRVLEQVGRGGMGTVYKAVDETLDRTVAIKVLNADLLNQDSVERFRREAVMLARLSHPRIGAIHELTRDGHDLLMVMEFVGGETFERLVERMGTITILQACKLCIQVLEGLQYAHNSGVIHRDLKPANLIVMPNGDVKIMDFGIARMQGSEHLTSVGFMVGTPAYMSPEQVRGEEVDPRMDLYAIAVVLYRLLTHHLPFQGDTAIALIHSQLNNPPTPPRQFRADLPEWIVATLSRGLAKGRGDRFQTAEEFRAALEGGLTGTMPIPAILGPGVAETIGPTATPPQMRVPVGTGTPVPPSGTPAPSPLAGTTPNPRPIGATPPPASGVPPSMIAAQPLTPAPGVTPFVQTPSRPMMVPPGQTPSPHAIPGTARPEATVTLRAPHLATAGVLLAVLVAGIAVLAVVALRRPTIVTQAPAVATTPAPAGAPPTSSIPATASASGGGSAATPSPAPGPPGTPASPSPPTAVTTAAPAASTTPRPTPGPTVSAGGSNSAGRSDAAAGRSSDVKAGEPARGRSTTATTPAPASAAAAAAPSPVEAPTQHFPDVKSLVVDGQRVREVDALLSLEPGSVIVRLRDEGSVLKNLPYRSITAATYIRGRRPRGQTSPNAAALPENFGGSGFLGNARHWLTLQTSGEFVVVRLEDRNVIRVLNGIEARTGLKVQRSDN